MTTTYNINFPIVDLSTSCYGSRVCFGANTIKVNPRNEIGKFGIRTHSGLTRLFHQTIKIKENDNSKKSFFLNKKSAVKWIQSTSKDTEITNYSTNKAIIEKIQKVLKSSPYKKKTNVSK